MKMRIISRLQKFHMRPRMVVLVLTGVFLVAGISIPNFRNVIISAATCGSTNDCQQQINALSNQQSQAQNSLAALAAQAGSYQAAIASLQNEINGLQGQIDANQAQQASLVQQIAEKQSEIDHERAVLSSDVKAMYVDGTPTTLEMLATSKNLSDFVDKQEYRTAVQAKLQDTLVQIAALQNQLQKNKAQVDQILAALNTQQAQLTAAQTQQNQLLSYNESQQATFNSQISASQAQINDLRRQQANLIQSGTTRVFIPPASGGSGGLCDNGYGNGSYPMPWCNAPQDTIATIPYSYDTINRECTSYAYWYFTQVEGHTDFRASGNARDWAYTSNYVSHSSPVVGAMAVETTGYYGHVAIVQALPGQSYSGQIVPSGYVLVSEMNYDWNGHFRYSYSPLSKFSAYLY